MSCYGEARWRAITCGRSATSWRGGAGLDGPAILLMAHLDSVAAGPGAGDDESGVAIILETIRALKARGLTTQPSGPRAVHRWRGDWACWAPALFLHDPAWRARVGVVINVEARGNQGRSYLFQTSPGDGALVDLYARNVPHPGDHVRSMAKSTNFCPMTPI